jgi:hypothetical protein
MVDHRGPGARVQKGHSSRALCAPCRSLCKQAACPVRLMCLCSAKRSPSDPLAGVRSSCTAGSRQLHGWAGVLLPCLPLLLSPVPLQLLLLPCLLACLAAVACAFAALRVPAHLVWGTLGLAVSML